jgi:hypothetical protein
MTRRKMLALSLLGALCVAVGGFLLVRALGGLGGKSYRNPFDRELAERGIRVAGPGSPASLGAGWQAEVDDGVRKTLIEIALVGRRRRPLLRFTIPRRSEHQRNASQAPECLQALDTGTE